jgi:ribosomal protein S18 acetylase RimI-like enzyme
MRCLAVVTDDAALLERLEAYYDAAPRARSRVEEVGPFTLFVAESGWPYYARPRFDPSGWSRQARPPDASLLPPDVDDVRKVFARQRELDVPLALEWVDETTPRLVEVVRLAGAHVEECPLLVLDPGPRGDAGSARMVDAEEREVIAVAQAAVAVSFSHGGTAKGAPGVEARDQQLRAADPAYVSTLQDRLSDGEMRMAVAVAPESPELGPVGGGSSIPIGGVAEIVGVGVLPAYRRRGLAGHLTYVLATDALQRGVRTVFCSGQSVEVARIYEGVGFRRVGTACIASFSTS